MWKVVVPTTKCVALSSAHDTLKCGDGVDHAVGVVGCVVVWVAVVVGVVVVVAVVLVVVLLLSLLLLLLLSLFFL